MSRETRMHSFRLTEEGVRLLELLATAYGVSRTAMIEIMIRDKINDDEHRLNKLLGKTAEGIDNV